MQIFKQILIKTYKEETVNHSFHLFLDRKDVICLMITFVWVYIPYIFIYIFIWHMIWWMVSYIYMVYGMHHWKIFRSSCRKLAWVGFEPTITEFRSDTLTDWGIRPWVQLALRANLVQLLQFHLFVQCSRFILVFAFVSRHICFKRSLVQVITLVAEWQCALLVITATALWQLMQLI